MQLNQNRIRRQPTVPCRGRLRRPLLANAHLKDTNKHEPSLGSFWLCEVGGVLFFFPRMRRTNTVTANTNSFALLQHLPQPFLGWIHTPWCKWPRSSFSSPVAQIRTLTWACHTSQIAAAYGQTLIRARFFFLLHPKMEIVSLCSPLLKALQDVGWRRTYAVSWF